VPKIIPIA